MEIPSFIDKSSQPGDQATVAFGMVPHDPDQVHQRG